MSWWHLHHRISAEKSSHLLQATHQGKTILCFPTGLPGCMKGAPLLPAERMATKNTLRVRDLPGVPGHEVGKTIVCVSNHPRNPRLRGAPLTALTRCRTRSHQGISDLGPTYDLGVTERGVPLPSSRCPTFKLRSSHVVPELLRPRQCHVGIYKRR